MTFLVQAIVFLLFFGSRYQIPLTPLFLVQGIEFNCFLVQGYHKFHCFLVQGITFPLFFGQIIESYLFHFFINTCFMSSEMSRRLHLGRQRPSSSGGSSGSTISSTLSTQSPPRCPAILRHNAAREVTSVLHVTAADTAAATAGDRTCPEEPFEPMIWGVHTRILEGTVNIWTSTLPISTLLRYLLRWAIPPHHGDNFVSIGLAPFAIITHAKGGLQNKLLKLRMDLNITHAQF
jgi:hypothetical protein